MVDDDALEVADEEVADDAERELGLLVDERGRLRPPARPRIVDQSFSRSLRSPSSSSSEAPSAAVRTMSPPSGELEALADRLQPLALVVLEPPRDADAVAVGRVDEEAARERDLRRQPGALRAHRVLDGLDEHLLAARISSWMRLPWRLPSSSGTTISST